MPNRIDKDEQARADSNAAAGAVFLDRKLPGWEYQVNVRKLDLGSGCDCVLGQLAMDIVPRQKWLDLIRKGCSRPSYHDAIGTLRLRYKTITKYGFTADFRSGRSDNVGFPALTKAWRKIISERTKHLR